VISVHSNVLGAAVFLNNEYQGTTPLNISGLAAGIYELRLEKQGYSNSAYMIYVSEGRSFSYYVPLERSIGFLDFSSLPAGSLIYVDSKKTDNSYIEVEEGRHEILIRRFGFKDVRGAVFVRKGTVRFISAKMTEDSFRLKSFSAAKRSFNPDYSGALGQTTFTASVTAPAIGVLSIKDESGEEVFRAELPEFSTWEQSIKWNGRANDGSKLAGGMYTADFSAGGQILSSAVRLDYSISYRPVEIGFAGSGIGSFPAAFTLPKKTVMLSAAVSPIFNTEDGFYSAPFVFALSYTPSDFAELSSRFTVNAANEKSSVGVNAAAKFVFSSQISYDAKICYGASVHYGYSGKQMFYPYGVQYGSGLGASAMFGLDLKNVYAGVSSSYTVGSLDGDVGRKDSALKNVVAFSFRPAAMTAIDAAFAINSAFNFYDGISDSIMAADFARAFDAQLGASFMIPNTSVILRTSASALIYTGGTSYIGGRFCIAYMF
ncbi:MAG: PEGA domain-containing protein, partial [Treponema sp.]